MIELTKQQAYCKARKIPMFAPLSGGCYKCNRQIEDSDKHHITGCPYCHYSYCE